MIQHTITNNTELSKKYLRVSQALAEERIEGWRGSNGDRSLEIHKHMYVYGNRRPQPVSEMLKQS